LTRGDFVRHGKEHGRIRPEDIDPTICVCRHYVYGDFLNI
jgi:hypothetical protein